ncbi:MAG TPA: nitrous oxide reductase family maturation protein NosD [Gemmatimonadaceae bacterium]
MADRPHWRSAFGALLLGVVVATGAGAQRTIVVSPTGAVRTVTEAVRLASPGDRIVVKEGVYREPTIIVNKSVTIVGNGNPVLDGQGEREIMTVTADSVTVRGLVFRDVGSSYREDRAAIRVQEANGCTIDGNRFERAFFGIYLARVSGCRVTHNTIVGQSTTEAASGNGIHLWTADHVFIADNTISGHRDGIYFEFVHFSDVERNLSEENLRYGLHFMFSDQCRYRGNVFRSNGSGVAVMYTRHVEMTGNRMEQNWGAAAYGLLLKEIADVRLDHNTFAGNTTGLMADGTTRLTVTGNRFADNGWALKLDANTQAGRVAANDFVGNTFDVATNGNSTDTVLEGNYWDAYRGYDLKRDGYGDVPFRPVRLFSVLVERNSPALILLRSTFVALLDAAERVIPALTPDALADARPAMRPLHAGNGAVR